MKDSRVVLPLLLACLALGPPVPEAPARGSSVAHASDVDLTLFLIGDAGNPEPRGEPVLRALEREVARDPARSLVVFLGDNVYPSGLPPGDDPARPEMERRLDTQVDAVKRPGGRGIFVPGNHDWGDGAGGWEAVRRQTARIDERGAPLVSALPRDGCPGPEVLDAGEHLRLVALDTEWWLRGGPKPVHPTSDCPADSEQEVLEALRRALDSAGGRRAVVAAHHPLASGGPHAGYFTLRQHLFPLTDAKKRLWIPLPLIGSLYPLARKAGVSEQDMSNPVNARMREALEGVFRERSPLAYASGHEHNLQVFDGRSARYLLVSGAGIYGHTNTARRVEGTRYVSSKAGFMRLDLERSGRVRLGVLEVDRRGQAAERWAAWLD